MQFDKQALDRLLSMNDRQLSYMINKVAAENGIDLSSFNMDPKDIASVRHALSGATDADIRRVAEQYEDFKRNGGRRGR